MDRRIRLQRMDEQRSSGSGEKTQAPVDVARLWAEKRPLSGSERYQAGQLAAKVDTIFVIRHRAGVTPQMRIVEVSGGRIYNIRAVLEVGRANRLELLAEARGE